MNASRLQQFIKFLLTAEQRLGLQQKLSEFSTALTNLVAQPQAPAHQTAVANSINTLEESFRDFENALTPAQHSVLNEIGATAYFSASVVTTIRNSMAQNPLTPTVVQQSVNKIISQRVAYIEALKSAESSLTTLGVSSDDLAAGEAEIGFLIPRELFSNRLDLLVKELRDVELIIRQFSEVVVGSVEEVSVKQISTSNPIFFFGLDPTTVAAIAASITWMLNTWKQALEIKKKYNDLKELGLDEDVLGKIEANVKKKVEQSIKERAGELIREYRGDGGRKSELETGLKWAMQALMARVERGLIIEVRSLPPPKPPVGTTQADADIQSKRFDELSQIAKALEFPAIEGEPILQIPPQKNVDGTAEPKAEAKKKSNPQ
jgi:hypothetical protein